MRHQTPEEIVSAMETLEETDFTGHDTTPGQQSRLPVSVSSSDSSAEVEIEGESQLVQDRVRVLPQVVTPESIDLPSAISDPVASLLVPQGNGDSQEDFSSPTAVESVALAETDFEPEPAQEEEEEE